MDHNMKWLFAATFALAFLIMGAMVFLSGFDPITAKSPNRTSAPVEAGKENQPSAQAPGVERQNSATASDYQPPHSRAIENATATTAQAESAALRDERRRLARAVFEEFRKSGKAAPDWETTSHPALFLPDGKPVDPYMLPSLQLPAAMTIENPAIEITTDLQVAEWERLQDEFIAEVGGTLPNDPASREIWIQAQRKSDERFRLKFGTEAFLRQQMDAYRKGFLQM
jgi:hypothetical protein